MRIPTTTIAALAVLLLPAAGAQAASKPTVSTGSTSQVTPTTAILAGQVNPQGQSTTYSFQYGKTTTYGTQTPAAPAGSGTKAKRARVAITGLEANTKYHYRIVASNPTGVTSGKDRAFTTDKIPQSLTLAANPNPLRYGRPTSLSGQIAGTGGGGRTVQIQLNSFPYTAGFVKSGNPIVSAADGTFSTVISGLLFNAQFRAVTTTNPKLTSNVVAVGVQPIVHTHVSTHRPKKGSRVRFSGTVTPSWLPAQVAIQKKTSNDRWVVVAGTITHSDGTTRARYSRRVTVKRGGTYRVFVGLPDSRYAPTTGSEVKLRVKK